MNGYLRVINALEIFKRPDSVIKVMSNSTRPVDISVKAKGDACCMIDVLYYFNQTSVALTQYTLSNPPFRRNSTTGELSFDPSSIPKEDLEKWVGDYKCRVSNKHESKVFDFIIVTEESNRQPITAAEASTGLWWIYILLGVLAIAIVFVVVIVIYKSNYPGETYQLEKTELKHHLNPEEDLLNQSFQEI
ncbi:hypothetical protein EGW08_017860 [Elysia chlorotica]|uniref:Ig-like domain-containing protein n=1 Tax=Elysia chlorotica TaxID=188477 RepID=A0A3S1B3V9_ELYCH|nr:hypothetical protein EGW08_017860 [Elysia chlorotica]